MQEAVGQVLSEKEEMTELHVIAWIAGGHDPCYHRHS